MSLSESSYLEETTSNHSSSHVHKKSKGISSINKSSMYMKPSRPPVAQKSINSLFAQGVSQNKLPTSNNLMLTNLKGIGSVRSELNKNWGSKQVPKCKSFHLLMHRRSNEFAQSHSRKHFSSTQADQASQQFGNDPLPSSDHGSEHGHHRWRTVSLQGDQHLPLDTAVSRAAEAPGGGQHKVQPVGEACQTDDHWQLRRFHSL